MVGCDKRHGLGSVCQDEPSDPQKSQFQTTTEKAVEEPRAKQGLCKAEIKYKIVWVDKRRKEMEAERGRGREPKKQPQWSLCVDTIKSVEK